MHNSSDRGTADIIVPVHNGFPYTRALLENIYRYTDYPFHLFVIDNASEDETADLHKIYARDITIVHNREDRGWNFAINQGIQLGMNPYLVFLHNDLQVSQGWLRNMILFLDTHPRIAAVGPLTSDAQNWQCVDRVRQKLVPQIPKFFTDDIHERNQILRYHFQNAGILVEETLAFSCLVLRRRAVIDVGMFSESNTNGSHAAYCTRLRKAGYMLGLSLGTYVVQNPAVQVSSTKGKTRKPPRLAVSKGAKSARNVPIRPLVIARRRSRGA